MSGAPFDRVEATSAAMSISNFDVTSPLVHHDEPPEVTDEYVNAVGRRGSVIVTTDRSPGSKVITTSICRSSSTLSSIVEIDSAGPLTRPSWKRAAFETIRGNGDFFGQLEARFGGEYDGWEASVR